MDSEPRQRRGSRELPPDLSELMNKLIEYANSFIKEFDNSEAKMREIVGEFQKIVDEVTGVQEGTDTVRTLGAVIGGVGAGMGMGSGLMTLGLISAPFTGGLSLVTVAAGTVTGGVVAVVGANITKIMKENKSAEKVEKLGREFMEIIEPLKNDLEEIKTTCDKLKEESGGFQAENTLTDVKEFQRILGRVSQLRTKSEGAWIVVQAMIQVIKDLSVLLVQVFRVTATPEDDKKLRDAIIQSADQCQKVVDEFDQVKKELEDFTGN